MGEPMRIHHILGALFVAHLAAMLVAAIVMPDSLPPHMRSFAQGLIRQP